MQLETKAIVCWLGVGGVIGIHTETAGKVSGFEPHTQNHMGINVWTYCRPGVSILFWIASYL